MEIANRKVLADEKEALRARLQIEEGDCIFSPRTNGRSLAEVLGRIRLRIAEIQKLTAASQELDFLWVTDFPLLQWSADENKWNAVHHPFTRPNAEDLPLLDEKKYGEVRAEPTSSKRCGDRRRKHSNPVNRDFQKKMFRCARRR